MVRNFTPYVIRDANRHSRVKNNFSLNKRFLLDGEQINLYNIQLTNGIVDSR
jgi:hypothetical protein